MLASGERRNSYNGESLGHFSELGPNAFPILAELMDSGRSLLSRLTSSASAENQAEIIHERGKGILFVQIVWHAKSLQVYLE
jgi:hypothetical protein